MVSAMIHANVIVGTGVKNETDRTVERIAYASGSKLDNKRKKNRNPDKFGKRYF